MKGFISHIMKITLPDENSASQPSNTPGQVETEGNLEASELSQGERIKHSISEEKRKWKELTGKERLVYFFDYYKWPVIIGVLIIIVVSYLVVNTIQDLKPTALSIAVLNSEYDGNKLNRFRADYLEANHLEENVKFVVSYDYEIHTENYLDSLHSLDKNTSTAYQALSTYIQADYYDAIFSDGDGYAYTLELGLIYNLETVLPEEELTRLADYIVYADLDEFGHVPMAIDISQCKKLATIGLSYEDAYLLCPCASNQNKKNLLKLVQYLFPN